MVGHLFEQADLLPSQLSSDVKFQIGRDAEAKPLLSSGASGYPLVAGEGLQALQQQFDGAGGRLRVFRGRLFVRHGARQIRALHHAGRGFR